MELKKLKQINKDLQKQRKLTAKDSGYREQVFIRHWNVFLNQIKGNDISVIEQSSRTPLYLNILEELSVLTSQELKPIETDYLQKKSWFLISYNTPLFNLLKSKIEEYSKESSDE